MDLEDPHPQEYAKVCGIAAIIHTMPDAASVRIEELETFRRVLGPRGPDGSGVWLSPDGKVGMAHTRLATQDARPEAGQPIWDTAREVVVVFNGEVYNHNELRTELRGMGCTFLTRSDAEVLPSAWKVWGIDMLRRLEGQYSFVLHDTRRGDVLAARDPVGICPLYACECDGRLSLASTVDTLLQLSGARRGLDLQAAHDFFIMDSAGWGRTPVAGISSVRAGHAYLFRVSEPAVCFRHDALSPGVFAAETACSEAEWIEAVRSELAASATACMRGDKEAGVYLSGGVDSLAVQALIKLSYPDLIVQTFSAGFAHVMDGEVVGELPFARRMAAHFGTIHHEVVVTDRDLLSSLGSFDLPSESILPTVMHKLAAEASANGVAVALSGEGSDEIFFGYDHGLAALGFLLPEYGWLLKHYSLRGEYSLGLKSAEATLVDVFRGGGVSIDMDNRRSQLFGPASIRTHSALEWATHLIDEIREAAPNVSLDQLIMSLDLRQKLPENFLRRGEGPSMAQGVEMRFPFLWPGLLRLVLRMPLAFRVGDGMQSKPVLRKALVGILPEEALAQPKSPFGLPASRQMYFEGSRAGFQKPAFSLFFHKHFHSMADALLHGSWLSEGIFPPGEIEKRMQPQRSQDTACFDPFLWKLWSFACWYERVLG